MTDNPSIVEKTLSELVDLVSRYFKTLGFVCGRSGRYEKDDTSKRVHPYTFFAISMVAGGILTYWLLPIIGECLIENVTGVTKNSLMLVMRMNPSGQLPYSIKYVLLWTLPPLAITLAAAWLLAWALKKTKRPIGEDIAGGLFYYIGLEEILRGMVFIILAALFYTTSIRESPYAFTKIYVYCTSAGVCWCGARYATWVIGGRTIRQKFKLYFARLGPALFFIVVVLAIDFFHYFYMRNLPLF